MGDPDPRYSFDPLERRGVLLGLQPAQLLAFAVAALLAFAAGRARLGFAGAAGVFVVVAATGVWTRQSRPACVWLVEGIFWVARRARGPVLDPVPLRGYRAGAEVHPPANAPANSNAAPAGITLEELDGGPVSAPLGVVVDRRGGTWAAVVAVRGRSFALLDPADQARRLDGWRVALNAVGRPGTAVRRVQWVQRSRPATGLPAFEDLPAGAGRAADSYLDLVAGAGAPQLHDAWVVIAVEGPGARNAGAGARAAEVLRRELRLLEGQLRNADLEPAPALGLEELARLVGEVYEAAPSSRRSLRRPRSPWPLAEDEEWSRVHAGGMWHATYWVADWPRVDVRPDFLAPMLIGDGRRSFSVVMEPVPPERSSREIRSARTADAADEQLRSRAGFLPDARRGREVEGVMRREAELAEGHAEFRFSGYVSVHAVDREGLDTACAEAEHAAQAAQLELRRLYGRQREALSWTLPLARGLR